MEKILRLRYNVMDITSVNAFGNIRGGFRGGCKDVYFVRLAGTDQQLLKDISDLDRQFTEKMEKGLVIYRRISSFPVMKPQEIAYYKNCYEAWLAGGKTLLETKNSKGKGLGELLGAAWKQVLAVYDRGKNSESMQKNFAVKLMGWLDFVLESFPAEWDQRIPIKIVADNITKTQEYLFFYLLTLLGFDVLLIQNEKDISKEDDRLGLSKKVVLGEFFPCSFPSDSSGNRLFSQNDQTIEKPENAGMPVKQILPDAAGREEKSFEQLALSASSVVMISVYNEGREVIGTGSGIMIGKDGYILTNYHVICEGKSYSIQIEENEQVYQTKEMIKYNSLLDLAVLRIDRVLSPIPIYQGKPLVRGQKVVAIGSPLGLFNSVSDGIISGFRMINDVSMIQFTAPISQGSSGGALLNMQGELIGISTAGFDRGQNINLAVSYENILKFIPVSKTAVCGI